MQAYPRAFVVPAAQPLSARAEVLAVLAKADFRQLVFLEDPNSDSGELPTGNALDAEIRKQVMNRSVTLVSARPNEVSIEVGDGPPGFLVLTDIYFPGWACTIDGQPQRLYRANYLFRAVAVGAGRQTVTFTFLPVSYQRGRLITLASAALILVLLIGWSAHRLVVGPPRQQG
jgi:hypothetical protein